MSYMKRRVNLSNSHITINVFADHLGQTWFRCPQCNMKIWTGPNHNPDKEPIRRYECVFCHIGTILVHYRNAERRTNGNNKK